MSVSLRNNLKSLKVHWTGPKSDQAFKLLKKVSTLKSLTIEISRSTTNVSYSAPQPLNMVTDATETPQRAPLAQPLSHFWENILTKLPQCVSEREASVTAYFNSKGPARLCDALGYDELVSLRGVEEVDVEHVHGRQALRRTHEERWGLERALVAHITAQPEGE